MKTKTAKKPTDRELLKAMVNIFGNEYGEGRKYSETIGGRLMDEVRERLKEEETPSVPSAQELYFLEKTQRQRVAEKKQELFDDRVRIAGKKVEEFLKERYKPADYIHDIEKFVDHWEEACQWLIERPEKLEAHFKEFNDLEKMEQGFRAYLKRLYPSLAI